MPVPPIGTGLLVVFVMNSFPFFASPLRGEVGAAAEGGFCETQNRALRARRRVGVNAVACRMLGRRRNHTPPPAGASAVDLPLKGGGDDL